MARGSLYLIALVGSVAAVVGGTFASAAKADGGWVAVAISSSSESMDWGFGSDRTTAENMALVGCAQVNDLSTCKVASSSGCVAVAWDGAQPLNRPHAAYGSSPQAAVQTAMSLAGQYANAPAVRCSS